MVKNILIQGEMDKHQIQFANFFKEHNIVAQYTMPGQTYQK